MSDVPDKQTIILFIVNLAHNYYTLGEIIESEDFMEFADTLAEAWLKQSIPTDI